MLSRREYEDAINNAEFFAIDRTDNETLWLIQYRRLSSMIVEYYKLYVWRGKTILVAAKQREDTMSVCGVELATTIRDTLKHYKADKGIFLHYFAAALSKKVNQRAATIRVDAVRKGLNIDSATQKKIRAITSYANAKGYDLQDESVIHKIATKLDITVAELHRYIDINSNSAVMHETIERDDGPVSLFDVAAVNRNENAAVDVVLDMFDNMQTVYEATQQRSRQLISGMLTLRILNNYDNVSVDMLSGYSFCNLQLCGIYDRGDALPTETQYCDSIGVSMQSASRTLRIFLDKCRIIGS